MRVFENISYDLLKELLQSFVISKKNLIRYFAIFSLYLLFFLSVNQVQDICADKVYDLRSIYFIQTIDSFKKGRLMEHKIWMHKNKIRMEYIREGKFIVDIIKGEKIYTYFPSKNVGVVRPFVKDQLDNYQIKPEMIQSANKMMDYLTLMQAQIVGKENIREKRCDIFQFKDPKSNEINTLWLDVERKIPVKSQSKISGDIITIQYKNIQSGQNFDEDIFTVPSDVRLRELVKKTK